MSDYETGYRRPPREHQFRSGQSGNPNGRRVGVKDAATVLRELLSEKVLIRDAKGERYVTTHEAMLRKLIHSALEGDRKAVLELIVLMKKTPPAPSMAPAGIPVSYVCHKNGVATATDTRWRLKNRARIAAGFPEAPTPEGEFETWDGSDGYENRRTLSLSELRTWVEDRYC